MKYLKKFDSSIDANEFYVQNIPFICLIQNEFIVSCDEKDKIIEFDDNNKPVVNTFGDLVGKYNDHIIMVNRAKLIKDYPKLENYLKFEDTPSMVQWYKVSEPEDISIGIGYYYTTADANIEPGDYYVLINIPASDEFEGFNMRSSIYTVKQK